jgi:hypothetical protein
LQGGESLSAVTLLNADMNIVLLGANVGFAYSITFVREGVYNAKSATCKLIECSLCPTVFREVLNAHKTQVAIWGLKRQKTSKVRWSQVEGPVQTLWDDIYTQGVAVSGQTF